MSRATETTDISPKHLPGICKISTDLLREDTLVEPDPPVPCWKLEAVYYEGGARIEATVRNYVHGQMPSGRRAAKSSSSAMPTTSLHHRWGSALPCGRLAPPIS